MDNLQAIVITILIGAVVLVVMRWPERKEKREPAVDAKRVKLRAVAVFGGWCAFFAVLALLEPLAYIAFFMVVVIGAVPVGKEKIGVVKEILDKGFLSVFVVGPLFLLLYGI